jgi:hypothetical protein
MNSTASAEIPEGEGGYRPLECRQFAGDVLFLPSRWTHLTVNIGETIAIGGQETLYDDARYAKCLSRVGAEKAATVAAELEFLFATGTVARTRC